MDETFATPNPQPARSIDDAPIPCPKCRSHKTYIVGKWDIVGKWVLQVWIQCRECGYRFLREVVIRD